MNHRIVAIVFSLFVVTSSLQAQQKIAVVDLKVVFDNYFKTKIADSQLKEQGADFAQHEERMRTEYEVLQQEYDTLLKQANDQSVPAEQRTANDETAKAKLKELQQMQSNIENFRRTSQSALVEKQRRFRDNILREADEVIKTKAKSGNYSLVFDAAALSKNDTPVVLFADEALDLTQEVLKTMNESAPAELEVEN